MTREPAKVIANAHLMAKRRRRGGLLLSLPSMSPEIRSLRLITRSSGIVTAKSSSDQGSSNPIGHLAFHRPGYAMKCCLFDPEQRTGRQEQDDGENPSKVGLDESCFAGE